MKGHVPSNIDCKSTWRYTPDVSACTITQKVIRQIIFKSYYFHLHELQFLIQCSYYHGFRALDVNSVPSSYQHKN